MDKLRTVNRAALWIMLTSVIVLPVVSPGCKGLSDERRNQMEAEVMEIHDAVMPRTADINTLIEELDTLAIRVQADTKLWEAIMTQRAALKEADSLMWDWMYGYAPPNREQPADSVIAYFDQEKQKISLVSEKMLTSIEQAEQFLKSLPNDKD